MVMLRNLIAKMARHGVSEQDIAKEIGKLVRSTRDKLKGIYTFSMPEGIRIRDKFFPRAVP